MDRHVYVIFSRNTTPNPPKTHPMTKTRSAKAKAERERGPMRFPTTKVSIMEQSGSRASESASGRASRRMKAASRRCCCWLMPAT